MNRETLLWRPEPEEDRHYWEPEIFGTIETEKGKHVPYVTKGIGSSGGCGVLLTKWRVRKPKRKVFDAVRLFDKTEFVFIYENGNWHLMFDKQEVGSHLIIEGSVLRRKRYKGGQNIQIIKAIPTGLSYPVEQYR